MSGFPGRPQAARGGLVLLDPTTGRALRTIPFQYNPDTVKRTIKARGAGEDAGDRLEALRLTGPAVETVSFDAEFDAADQLDQPESNQVQAEMGLRPMLAALEGAVQPSVTQILADEILAATGVVEILPVESPLLVLALGRSRVLPVRITEFSISEEAFDQALNPIRAKVSLGLRVLGSDDLGPTHPGAVLSVAHHIGREATAARVTFPPRTVGFGG